MAERRVVVTGIGTINPLGNTIEEYFSNLEKGVSGAAPITHFDTEKFKTKFACEVKNYDPNQYFDRKEVRKYDRFTQYALIAADQAVQDAGFDLENLNKERAGVIWCSGIGGLKSLFDECVGYSEGGNTPRFSPFFIPRMIADIAAGYISIKYGFMGPNYCTVSACASSNHGLLEAFNQIRYGKAEVMITGGSEAAVNEPSVGGFGSMQAISTRNDDPQHASRPFDVDRDGFVIGEGAGAFILEEYEHAKARGAKIYCEFVGGGNSADAHHFTAPHPEGKGAMLAMREALRDAGLQPEDVDYINVHGTSTPLGDVAELKAVQGVFGDHAYHLNISSTKSMTGHLLGA
ncbi:MAG: beta-ketoacyl-ACP synthase II, partial [Alistipes sp.]|nr:beta-ketoacyl-ACP synthase II [Alistipes sp.]